MHYDHPPIDRIFLSLLLYFKLMKEINEIIRLWKYFLIGFFSELLKIVVKNFSSVLKIQECTENDNGNIQGLAKKNFTLNIRTPRMQEWIGLAVS